MSKIYSIYGAKYSKKGDRVNINLISGQNDSKEFACVSLPKNSDKIKIVEDLDTKTEYVYLKVKISKNAPKEDKEEIKNAPKEEIKNALPF